MGIIKYTINISMNPQISATMSKTLIADGKVVDHSEAFGNNDGFFIDNYNNNLKYHPINDIQHLLIPQSKSLEKRLRKDFSSKKKKEKRLALPKKNVSKKNLPIPKNPLKKINSCREQSVNPYSQKQPPFNLPSLVSSIYHFSPYFL